jgi:hypothetical protein
MAYSTHNKFIVVQWPESQALMDVPGFKENSLLINDGPLYDKYEDAAYMVNEEWLDSYYDSQLNALENQSPEQ